MPSPSSTCARIAVGGLDEIRALAAAHLDFRDAETPKHVGRRAAGELRPALERIERAVVDARTRVGHAFHEILRRRLGDSCQKRILRIDRFRSELQLVDQRLSDAARRRRLGRLPVAAANGREEASPPRSPPRACRTLRRSGSIARVGVLVALEEREHQRRVPDRDGRPRRAPSARAEDRRTEFRRRRARPAPARCPSWPAPPVPRPCCAAAPDSRGSSPRIFSVSIEIRHVRRRS